MVERARHLSVVEPAPARADDPQPLTARTDDELMLLARAGVRAAFNTLVRRHQPRVLAVAARLVGTWSLASDVAQDTFLQVHRALDRYRPCGKFGPYLHRVLVNQCGMARRSTRADDRGRRAVSRAPVEHVPAIDVEVLARERQRELQSALDSLSARLRVVVVLRFSGGLSHAEIAETLGLPVGTVKRRLFDAMGKLRQTMEET